MLDTYRWKLCATDNFFKYDRLEEISIGRFSRTPVKVFVLKKLQEDIRVHVDKSNETLKNFLMNKAMMTFKEKSKKKTNKMKMEG